VIKFNKPTNLNGAELLDELAAIGIILDKVKQAPFIDENGDLLLDVKASDKNKIAEIVDSHNGTTIAPEPTVEQKLASVGLNVAQLKSALGLDA
jgi:hypothetical protein